MSEEHITRRSLADSRPGKTDWEALRRKSDAEVEADAAGDPDNPAWSREELAAAEIAAPSESPKVPVSIRLDPEVLEFFKKGGRGYQSRISAVLRAYVRSRNLRSR